MKRSEINNALKEMEAMIKEYRFALPPFCDFTPEEWKEKNHEFDEIRDNMLGWDITDYGLGKFDEVGFSLITIRNGNLEFADTDVTVHCDGREFTVPAGTKVRLTPGESITIYPYMYHDFHVEEGSGDVLLGEVSMCNDDEHDNRFYEPIGRFPEIEEDEEPYRLLCNEYPRN